MPTLLLDDRYHLEEVLGSGAMGIVRAATDERLGRRVAIKLLADNLALDQVARERFEREARSAARVVHPNVVTVHDVGVAPGADGDDRPYIVMELVEGGSLRAHLLAQGALAPDEVGVVAAQSLVGLGAAHDVGLLHRDLKPANLLRDRSGTIKLTDFGIAYAGEQPGLTRTGYVLGSMAYLAPERLRGEPATASTDLYGLAATLLELLWGRPREREEPLRLPPSTSPGLRRLIERCLEDDPGQRPQDADSALTLLLDGVDTTVHRRHEEDVPTVPVAAGDAPTEIFSPTATLPAGGTAKLPSGAPTADPAPGRAERRDTPARRWGRRPAIVAAAIVVTALLVTLVFVDGGPDGGPGGPQPDPAGQVEDPVVDDARELRERVRELLGR